MKQFMSVISLFLFAAASFQQTAQAAANSGSLNTQFGNGGLAKVHVEDESNDIPQELAIQSNGKIVVFGSTIDEDEHGLRVEVARFNSNGSVDTSFGGNGTGFYVFNSLQYGSTGRDIGYSGLVQPDGKIIVAGSTQNFNGTLSKMFIARLNSNGCLDTSFGTNGVVITTIGPNTNTFSKVLRQSNGKLVATGFTITGAPGSNGPYDYDFAAVRYNSNGTLDNSFGTGGKVSISMGNGQDLARTAMLQSDGNIFIAGQSAIAGGFSASMARLLPTGQLDITFGFGGRLFTAVSGFDSIWEVQQQADGKIIIALQGCNPGITVCNMSLQRMYPTGSLDGTFGYYGMVTADTLPGNHITEGQSVAIQADGKIVLGGFERTNDKLYINRYLTDGSLDPDFGNNGQSVIQNKLDNLYQLMIQTDGKIVATGQAPYASNHGNGEGKTGYGFGLIRLWP